MYDGTQHVLHDPVDAQLPQARAGPGRPGSPHASSTATSSSTFSVVPYDPVCEGTTSTYVISDDRWTLEGVDVPPCSFRGFVRH